jgi:hypothetical protein
MGDVGEYWDAEYPPGECSVPELALWVLVV